MKQKLAVITGADGGMGMEITRAVATAGYKVIMACRDPEIAEEKRQLIMRETGNIALEIVPVNLASLSSTASFANELLQRGEVITLLMNNAEVDDTYRSFQRGLLSGRCAEISGRNKDAVGICRWFSFA